MHANKKKDAMDERPSTSPGLSFYRSSPAVKFSSPVDDRLCYHCSKPGHLKKYCPVRPKPVCHFCGNVGHIYDACALRKLWQESCKGKTEYERLWCLDIPDHNVVTLKPKESEFYNFDFFVRSAYKQHSSFCGGVLVKPPFLRDYIVPDLKSFQKEIVEPFGQIYSKHCDGVYLVEYRRQPGVSFRDFYYRSSIVGLEKSGNLDLGDRTPFWRAMLEMFDSSLHDKCFPHYVIDKGGTLFPKSSNLDWHLSSLRKTITPHLIKDVVIPGVNTTQLLFGEVQSFTCWHVEDLNLPSINYLHSGQPKFWIVVAEKYGERLKQLLKEKMPHYYELCDSAELCCSDAAIAEGI